MKSKDVVGQYILESLLFQAFCFCSRKRSLAAWLLCDQNWPITNASKGLPLAALAKLLQTLALITLRLCCSSLATSHRATQTQRAQKGLCFTKLASACFLRLPEENRGEQGAPKAGLVEVASTQKLQGLLPAPFLLGQESLQPRCLNISRSACLVSQ